MIQSVVGNIFQVFEQLIKDVDLQMYFFKLYQIGIKIFNFVASTGRLINEIMSYVLFASRNLKDYHLTMEIIAMTNSNLCIAKDVCNMVFYMFCCLFIEITVSKKLFTHEFDE